MKLFLFLFTALLISCTNNSSSSFSENNLSYKTDEWSEDSKKNYLRSCKQAYTLSDADEYCKCTLDKIMESYDSATDFKNNATSEEANKIASQCRK